MIRTRVGYAGGKRDKPTYRVLGDHTEAIQIEYDAKRIGFEDLLEVFWDGHNPFGSKRSTQYKAVLWTHGEDQARVAKAFVARKIGKSTRKRTTEIAVAPRFWIAEDYHQKYYLRKRPTLMRSLLGEKPDDATIRDSTLAARANGWLAGHGTKKEIASEVEAMKLDDEAKKALERALGNRAPVLCD